MKVWIIIGLVVLTLLAVILIANSGGSGTLPNADVNMGSNNTPAPLNTSSAGGKLPDLPKS